APYRFNWFIFADSNERRRSSTPRIVRFFPGPHSWLVAFSTLSANWVPGDWSDRSAFSLKAWTASVIDPSWSYGTLPETIPMCLRFESSVFRCIPFLMHFREPQRSERFAIWSGRLDLKWCIPTLFIRTLRPGGPRWPRRPSQLERCRAILLATK